MTTLLPLGPHTASVSPGQVTWAFGCQRFFRENVWAAVWGARDSVVVDTQLCDAPGLVPCPAEVQAGH